MYGYDGWWNTSGWWWWGAFLLILFLLPFFYGWMYRGWGPRYGRRQTGPGEDARAPGPLQNAPPRPPRAHRNQGWGWSRVVLWTILVIGAAWLVAALNWPVPPPANQQALYHSDQGVHATP